jgi:hypothetical protein
MCLVLNCAHHETAGSNRPLLLLLLLLQRA